MTPIKVFISYSHDSKEHVDRVLSLSNRLRRDGVDSRIDQYVPSPAAGWPRWMEQQIRDSEYVLMICTETYHRRVVGEERAGVGRGVRWEGHLIYNALYSHGAVNTKFVAVVFDREDAQFIPAPEQGFTFYTMPEEYDGLYRLLTKQPLTLVPKLGAIRILQRRDRALSTSAEEAGIRPPRHNLPQPHYVRFIGREDELRTLHGVLKPYPHSQHPLITIDGVGGIGKSALALEVALHYLRNLQAVPETERFDAIVWTSAKPNELLGDRIIKRRQQFHNLNDIYSAIVTTLALSKIANAKSDERHAIVRQALTQQRTLLVVDNLESVDDEAVIEFLQDLPAPTKAIVTTRQRIDVAYPIRLVGMKEDEALDLIDDEASKRAVELDSASKELLYRRTGGVPIAIVWSIAQMGFGYSIAATLQRLGDPSNDVAQFCFENSIRIIRKKGAYKLLLALTYQGGKASRKELGRIANLQILDRDDGLVELEKLSLVNKQGELFELLPLTLNYTRAELERASLEARENRDDSDNWTGFLASLEIPDIRLQKHLEFTEVEAKDERFDVFMAHNNQDKFAVLKIGKRLRDKGLRPWIDQEQIAPGQPFQDAIQAAIPAVRSAAVFVGEAGLGKWQALELRSFISQCIQSGIPVIPVLLPGVQSLPSELVFLREFNWVRFDDIEADSIAMDRLIWGITGELPKE